MKTVRTVLTLLLLAMLGCSDDDSPASPDSETPVVSVGSQTIVEGGTAIFIVSMDIVGDSPVTFQHSTSDGTAKAPEDYVAIPLSFDTIIPGSTGMAIIVPTVDDDSLEEDETFYLILGNLTGATFANSIGVGTILDNDAVSYAADVRTILIGSCAKAAFCHGTLDTSLAGGGLAMGATAEYTTIMSATGHNTGGRVVVPDSSNESTLYRKTLETPPFGNRMPQDGPPFLNIEQQQRIRDWIDQGSPDN